MKVVIAAIPLLMVSILVAGCAAGFPVSESTGRQTAHTFARTITKTIGYRSLVYLPPQYTETQRWPLLLFLHGSGERGNDLELVKRHGPPKLIAAGKNFPMIVVSPQCPDGAWWEVESLDALLDEVCRELSVDTNRIYVSGLSMGGFGTWALATTFPKRFAAVAPVCGTGEPFFAPQLKDLPIWAFHGAKDNVVPLSRQQEMIDAVKRAGGSPRFTVYPDAGHDSWTATYDNPDLYAWLLQHSRSNH